jgi:ElaB/YqjD/DUF883 family membrane-anchored ribosome-binding protein
MASPTNDTYRATADRVEDTVSRVGNEMAGKVADTAKDVQQQAKAQMDRLSVSIREKPLQSAAIAAGLGFLFAVVARR